MNEWAVGMSTWFRDCRVNEWNCKMMCIRRYGYNCIIAVMVDEVPMVDE